MILPIHIRVDIGGPTLVAFFGEFDPQVGMTYRGFEEVLVQPKSLPFTYQVLDFWTDERIDWGEQDQDKLLSENEWITVCPGKTLGSVIGGYLNTLMGIWGSEYMPIIREGDIFFIEDSMKDASTIERSFS